ncbi:glycosyltransferase [Xylanibacter muris]|uniref:Glycosyltransferase n=1 Tax=Xylanibacter muris TaxID=2736290 RepID=A0ABX2AKD2_9BACT|nr:glycosyltransferase [Xylanibacter muris]NPD91651.1 glycosyltransferase [Xylanibacter muris]
MVDKNIIFLADIRSLTPDGKIKTGHCVPVARMYKEIFKDEATLLITGGSVYHNYFPLQDCFTLPYNELTADLSEKWKTFKNCWKLFKKAEGKTIVFQSISPVTLFLCIILFYQKKSRIFLIQYNTFAVSTHLNHFLYKIAKGAFDGLICPNDYVGQKFKLPYCVVPDYIYTGNNSIIKNIKYINKQYDFCIIGRLNKDKGVIEAARHFTGKQYKLLIAGSVQSQSLQNELLSICRNADNIDLRIGYVSDEMYLQYLSLSRYAILNYMGEYSDRSSGVVFDTLFNDVPVIGRRCRALEFIEQNDIGYIYDSINKFNPDMVLNETFHSKCLCNIIEYRKKHKFYKKKLINFILQ